MQYSEYGKVQVTVAHSKRVRSGKRNHNRSTCGRKQRQGNTVRTRVNPLVRHRGSNGGNRRIALSEKDSERDIGGGSGLCVFGEEEPKGTVQ